MFQKVHDFSINKKRRLSVIKFWLIEFAAFFFGLEWRSGLDIFWNMISPKTRGARPNNSRTLSFGTFEYFHIKQSKIISPNYSFSPISTRWWSFTTLLGQIRHVTQFIYRGPDWSQHFLARFCKNMPAIFFLGLLFYSFLFKNSTKQEWDSLKNMASPKIVFPEDDAFCHW